MQQKLGHLVWEAEGGLQEASSVLLEFCRLAEHFSKQKQSSGFGTAKQRPNTMPRPKSYQTAATTEGADRCVENGAPALASGATRDTLEAQLKKRLIFKAPTPAARRDPPEREYLSGHER